MNICFKRGGRGRKQISSQKQAKKSLPPLPSAEWKPNSLFNSFIRREKLGSRLSQLSKVLHRSICEMQFRATTGRKTSLPICCQVFSLSLSLSIPISVTGEKPQNKQGENKKEAKDRRSDQSLGTFFFLPLYKKSLKETRMHSFKELFPCRQTLLYLVAAALPIAAAAAAELECCTGSVKTRWGPREEAKLPRSLLRSGRNCYRSSFC